MLLISGLVGFIFLVFLSLDLPKINTLADYNPPITSKIYSKDGELLLEIYKEKREIVSIEDVPQKIMDAFLSAEDDNFFSHSGIDYKGILRALARNIKAGKVVQGGSTITQQVAKSLLANKERSITRKLKDLLLAKRIEDKLTKSEILYLYLNQVYLGGGYYGIKSAFQGYFGKELADATAAEAALIAGLLVAPGKYSPYVNPKYAKDRQSYVLKRMYETGKIDEKEYEQAVNETIKLQKRNLLDMKGAYFTDWIRQRMVDVFGEEEFLTNGFEVVTTLNWKLQKQAELSIEQGTREIDKRQGYKGPKGKIDLSQLITMNLAKRKKYYEDKSSFFHLEPSSNIRKEFDLSDLDEVIVESSREVGESKDVPTKFKKGILLGNNPNDPLLALLKKDDLLEGVVVKVSNAERIICVDVMGSIGFIPYDYYKWAHKRHISIEPQYYSYITNPSEIVSIGDKIEVRIKSINEKIFKHFNVDFKNNIKNESSYIKFLQEQNYLLLELEQTPDVQAALVALSPINGDIISMVGGRDFAVSQFNRATQSSRQPGSAFKPLIYAAALEEGYHPSSILLDSPQALGGASEELSWKPRNYDGKFYGRMTLRRALETSRNIPTIKLLQDVGIDKVINFTNRLKLNAKMPNDLSISLGSFGVSLIDLVKSYSIFPAGGKNIKFKSIVSIKDRQGNVHHLQEDGDSVEPELEVLDENSALDLQDVADNKEIKENPFHVNLTSSQVYDSRLAFIMTNLLRGVITHGTGKGASDLSSFLAGKTGTTNNYIDAWFLGYTSNIVTGVWAGFDNNETLGFGETGARTTLPVWKSYMGAALSELGEYDYKVPNGIVNTAIDRETGKLTNPDARNSFIEAFVHGYGPEYDNKNTTDKNGQDDNPSILGDDDFYSE
jgi:penicillin-binding protein 1A